MIENYDIGIDLSNIERFKKKPFETNKSFYKKIFTAKEITYCLKYKNPHERFAGKFALKEALIKSINKKVSFSEIETFHLNSKPMVEIKKFKKNYNFIASISHENNFAIAVVVSEKII
tara:strand:+ start:1501 stop:1854 length:354 start_codon:yes stop_codon:yes gene_type:complete